MNPSAGTARIPIIHTSLKTGQYRYLEVAELYRMEDLLAK